jgi:hypothetical protein
MGFPDLFIFDLALPSLPQVLNSMNVVGRILLHLAALIGLLT